MFLSKKSTWLAAALLVASGAAHAYPDSGDTVCPSGGYGPVHGTQSGIDYVCVNGVDSNPNDTLMNNLVTTAWEFNSDSWTALQKQNMGGSLETGAMNINLQVVDTSGDNRAGTWSFSSDVWNTYDQLAITMANGRLGDPAEQWAAFLVVPNDVSGTWQITSEPQGSLSNFTVYGCVDCGPPPPDPGNNVPEPVTLLLVGAGTVGVIYRRRRREPSGVN